MMRFRQTHPFRSQPAKKLLVIFFAFSLVSIAVLAQQTPAKRPLNHNDYDTWRQIQAQQLTRDAKFLGYTLNPQDADGDVVVRNLASSQEWRYNRGHKIGRAHV